MNSSFYHLQVNVNVVANGMFYKDLFSFLGWSIIHEDHDVVGFKSKTNGDLWFYHAPKQEQTDYDKMGMNHIGIRVDTQADIDALVSYCSEKNITPLFETPRHRAEFSAGPDDTYYQVMFTSPDNILFEVVYIGSK